MRAIISLPVPLSPWMSTGTLAAAILASRSRRARMASVEPNMTESGGISPKGWIKALTGFDEALNEVLIGGPGFRSTGLCSDVHPENQTLANWTSTRVG